MTRVLKYGAHVHKVVRDFFHTIKQLIELNSLCLLQILALVNWRQNQAFSSRAITLGAGVREPLLAPNVDAFPEMWSATIRGKTASKCVKKETLDFRLPSVCTCVPLCDHRPQKFRLCIQDTKGLLFIDTKALLFCTNKAHFQFLFNLSPGCDSNYEIL